MKEKKISRHFSCKLIAHKTLVKCVLGLTDGGYWTAEETYDCVHIKIWCNDFSQWSKFFWICIAVILFLAIMTLYIFHMVPQLNCHARCKSLYRSLYQNWDDSKISFLLNLKIISKLIFCWIWIKMAKLLVGLDIVPSMCAGNNVNIWHMSDENNMVSVKIKTWPDKMSEENRLYMILCNTAVRQK